jgi:hypothetical protein
MLVAGNLVAGVGAATPSGAATPAATLRTSPSSARTASDSAAVAGSPGYWLVSSSGQVSAFGGASDYGSVTGALAAPVVGMASTPDGRGYWLVGADGGIFAFGDATFSGSMGGQHLNAAVVGMATAPGGGYWLAAADGGVFAFGPAAFDGSMGGSSLNAPIVGIAAAPAGGYWLVGHDGGVFTFGASFWGAASSHAPVAPIVGIAGEAQGGYLEVGSDGGVFAFGPGADFGGSMAGQALGGPVVAVASVSTGGYQLVGDDGGVYSLGGAGFSGSLGGTEVDDVVGAAVPSPNILPISYYLEGGTIPRAVVMVSVAGGPAERMVLDTGSTGLHFSTSAVGTDRLRGVAGPATETYGSVQYTGPIDSAPISVGGVSSVAPVAFMNVQTVSCVQGDSCSSPNAAALVANGIYGTIGVSLSSFAPGNGQATLYSPLLQLPGATSGFSIGFTSATSGSVTLGAGQAAAGSADIGLTTKAPYVYPNGSKAWDVAGAQVCWTLGGQGPVCSPGGTTFDTGTSAPAVETSRWSPLPPITGDHLTSGTVVSLSLPDTTSPFWTYSAGTSWPTDTSINAPTGANLLGTAGLPIYFANTITYNAAQGQIVVTPDAP